MQNSITNSWQRKWYINTTAVFVLAESFYAPCSWICFRGDSILRLSHQEAQVVWHLTCFTNCFSLLVILPAAGDLILLLSPAFLQITINVIIRSQLWSDLQNTISLLPILLGAGDLIWPQRAAKSVMGSTLSSILCSAGASKWPIRGQYTGHVTSADQ